MLFSNCLVALLLLTSLCNADDVEDGTVFVVGLLPDPVYERANVTWPVAPPTVNDLHNIKVTITNIGDADDDVGFHTYFPDYAEMTSFTMHTEGVAYEAKKTNRKVAQNVLDQAKTGGHVAAVHFPKKLPDVFNYQIQTTENSVHIKGNKEITFNIEYKETLQDMIDSGVKVQNRAQVVFDLFGSTVENMVGEVSSPNYPHPYPNSADIAWLVRVPDDNIVELSIVDIDIEECCDRLTIYEGSSFHGQVIASLSGNMADQNNLTIFHSTSSSMSLHLLSDCSDASSGFKAVTSVGVISSTTKSPLPITSTLPDPPATTTTFPQEIVNTTYPVNNGNCDGYEYLYPSVTGGYYYLSSPNYPQPYHNNIDCNWEIYAPYPYGSISLKVLTLDLESGYDYVYFYGRSYDIIAYLTGSLYSSEPILSQGLMEVNFRTDSSVSKSGFNFQYEIVSTPHCNQTKHLIALTEYNDIMSLNYPKDYYNYLYCTWSIHSSSPGNVIEVYIVDFSIDIYEDNLVFYDGPSQYYERIAYAFQSGSFIYSKSEDLYIAFKTDPYSSGNYGFHLTYRSVYGTGQTLPSYEDPTYNNTNVACDTGLYMDVDPYTYSYIYSPNYPHLYANDTTCTWYIQTTYPGHGVQIEVNDALLLSDWLYIYEGWEDYDNNWSVYGNMFQRFFSKSPQVKVVLQSYNTDKANKFLFLVKSAPIPACVEGQILDIYSGFSYLTSPNYPNGYYNQMHCSWTIHSHNEYYIFLEVINLDIAYDWISIYDGPSYYYYLIASLSTDQQDSPWYSTGYYMYVMFDTSYYYQTSIGFQFRYSTTSNQTNDPTDMQQDCSIIHHISLSNGTITSNNYPGDYANNTTECWIFDSGYGIVDLHFDEFYLDYNDQLTLYSGNRYVDRYYDSYYPYNPRYYGYGLWMQFNTDSSNSEGGFSIDYVLSY